MPNLTLPTPTTPTFYFIGVTTSHSSSRQMFPRWMQTLNRPEVQWQGIDLPLHADPESYRQVVHHIKQEPLALGALVTSHKLDLLAAAKDLFDEIGPYASQTNEVSSIAKDGGKLIGRATDPVAGGLSLDAILGANYFARTGGEVLLLGAGGTAVALSLHLLQKPHPGDRPRRLVAVDLSHSRLTQLKQMMSRFNTDIQLGTIENDKPQHNDELMATLPAGSVVINATGMGKDRPGSPITNHGLFPQNGVAWELNYRGQLDFYHQAKAQQSPRNLTVTNGWHYFVYGWAQVIAHVLHLEINPPLFATLSQLAAQIR
jgi:shikimate 5-dehydrogenase